MTEVFVEQPLALPTVGSGEISWNPKINGEEPDLIAFCIKGMVYNFFFTTFFTISWGDFNFKI